MRSHMRNRLAIAAASLSLCAAAGVIAEESYEETRTHYVLTDAAGAPVGHATKISRVAEAWDRYLVLFRSSDGDEVVLEQGIDFAAKKFEVVIRDVRGDDWIKLWMLVPYAGDTRSTALRGVDQNLKLYETMSDYVTFETNGGEWGGFEKDWVGKEKRRFTIQLRQAVPFRLLDLIERTRGTVYAAEKVGVGSNTLLGYLLYERDCASKPPVVHAAIPDCGFDKSFGFPCSERQQENVAKAVEAQHALKRY